MNPSEQFYSDYKTMLPEWPAIPNECQTDEQVTRWLFKQDVPYIEIDLTIDIEKWQEEARLVKDYFVPHREEQDHKGWNSCCLHGTAVHETGIWFKYYKTEQEYHWTELSELSPNVTNFWKSLPFENFARVRFMELEAGGYIEPHSDSPKDVDILDHIIPFNIAIDHPDNCYMTIKDKGIVPWSNGNIKLVNITKYHSVINFSNQNRMHAIGHGIIGNKFNEFCQLISRSYRKQYERISNK